MPTLAASSTLPPSAAMAAATLVGAPPGFFKKLSPSDKGLPLSVHIISINASPIQSIFFIVLTSYSSELIQCAINEFSNAHPLITEQNSGARPVDISHAIGYITDMRIENSNLIGEVHYFKDAEIFNTYSVRPNGVGALDDDGVVADGYRLIGFYITNDPA